MLVFLARFDYYEGELKRKDLIMTIFKEQLKTFRAAKQLSQDDLAKKLYISRQAISKWENGDATPDIENLVKLADILEVSLDQLVKGDQKVPSQENKIEDDLHLLNNREYTINPETGKYEKRDGLTILLALFSEYWWLIFFAPLIISFLKLFFNLF